MTLFWNQSIFTWPHICWERPNRTSRAVWGHLGLCQSPPVIAWCYRALFAGNQQNQLHKTVPADINPLSAVVLAATTEMLWQMKTDAECCLSGFIPAPQRHHALTPHLQWYRVATELWQERHIWLPSIKDVLTKRSRKPGRYINVTFHQEEGPAAACTAGSVYLTGTIVRLYFSRQLCNQPTHRPVEAENGWPAPLCDCALRRGRCLHFKSSHTWRLIRPFMSLSSRGSIDLYSLPTAHGAKSARK